MPGRFSTCLLDCRSKIATSLKVRSFLNGKTLSYMSKEGEDDRLTLEDMANNVVCLIYGYPVHDEINLSLSKYSDSIKSFANSSQRIYSLNTIDRISSYSGER